jgi:cytidylate kinase
VVCISSLEGAGGEEVGRLVAERLGLRLVDEEIILRAAREAGVDSHVVADAEQRKSLAARVLKEILASSVAAAPALGVTSPASSRDALDDSDDFRGVIGTAIEETAAEGDCVIVAHAASVALSGRAGTLRVLVTASPDTRSGRVARESGTDEPEAAELVVRSDAARADYLKRFYRLRDEPPTLYDLVLNTDRLSPEQAALLIAEAAMYELGSDGGCLASERGTALGEGRRVPRLSNPEAEEP